MSPQAASGSGGTLSRELVKWTLSLDLSYSIKFPRRDLSNGFLVAEILSRYFPEDVSMHSFVNGSSSLNKTANWALLSKIMRKIGIRCPQSDVSSIIASEGDAAIELLRRLFDILHKRARAGHEVLSPGAQYSRHFTMSLPPLRLHDPQRRARTRLPISPLWASHLPCPHASSRHTARRTAMHSPQPQGQHRHAGPPPGAKPLHSDVRAVNRAMQQAVSQAADQMLHQMMGGAGPHGLGAPEAAALQPPMHLYEEPIPSGMGMGVPGMGAGMGMGVPAMGAGMGVPLQMGHGMGVPMGAVAQQQGQGRPRGRADVAHAPMHGDLAGFDGGQR